ncbi:MAG: DUF4861 family protein [Balneolaceae bacterium]
MDLKRCEDKIIGMLFGMIVCFSSEALAQGEWYTEGDYAPTTRIEVTIVNPLNIERQDTPVSIHRPDLPFSNFGPREVMVVDPDLPSRPEPTEEERLRHGGHLTQEETNGSAIPYQLDDLDRDGLWDELFFVLDLMPRETKTVYLYLGYNNRGKYVHKTFAAIGDYSRHPVPMWESEVLTWKLFYPTDVDIQAKREPILNGYYSLVNNMSGYHFAYERGTDIMTVGTSFGSGGIGLFESAQRNFVSRPRFSPHRFSGPLEDTRYVFEVVSSGPIRSIVRVKTLNWRTGRGEYELEQYYTAYKGKYYSTCQVSYGKWYPLNAKTNFAAGIRKIMFETDNYIQDGVIISTARNMPVIDPNPETIDRERGTLDYAAVALAVKEKYHPEYQFISSFEGNHTFRIPVNGDRSYEYLIAAGWSDAPEYTTAEEFQQYVLDTVHEYNNPPRIAGLVMEEKEEGFKPIDYWTPPGP